MGGEGKERGRREQASRVQSATGEEKGKVAATIERAGKERVESGRYK